jgi:hypothetical protein
VETKEYIPNNSYDVLAVERLKRLPFEAIRNDIPKLLEWLQDLHWDVAEGIVEYLLPHVGDVTQELLFVLNSDDSMWKYCVINGLIARSKGKLDPELIIVLKKIAEHPSKIDSEDAVDEAAKMIIQNKNLWS